jgi:hypothetical protein
MPLFYQLAAIIFAQDSYWGNLMQIVVFDIFESFIPFTLSFMLPISFGYNKLASLLLLYPSIAKLTIEPRRFSSSLTTRKWSWETRSLEWQDQEDLHGLSSSLFGGDRWGRSLTIRSARWESALVINRCLRLCVESEDAIGVRDSFSLHPRGA